MCLIILFISGTIIAGDAKSLDEKFSKLSELENRMAALENMLHNGPPVNKDELTFEKVVFYYMERINRACKITVLVLVLIIIE